MKLFILLSCMTALVAVPALADLPGFCSTTSLDGVQRLLLIPDRNGSDPHPAASFTVTVKDWDCIPIPNAVVEVLIGGLASNKTRLCGSAVTVRNTDANGVVSFNIGGGGCLMAMGALVIRANGVEIRNFNAVLSPDYAGWDNAGIPGRSDLKVGPQDLAAFVAAYQGGAGAASCHDYNNNGVTDPGDLGVFVSAYSGGTRDCSP